MGHKPTIQGLLRAAPADVAKLLEAIGAYATEQELVATPLEHCGWASVDRLFRIGDQTRLVDACTMVFAPPPERPQPDLFQDGTVPLLAQEIQQALAKAPYRSGAGADRTAGAARPLSSPPARLPASDPGHRQSGYHGPWRSPSGAADHRAPSAGASGASGSGFSRRPVVRSRGVSRKTGLRARRPKLHASFAWPGPGAGMRCEKRWRQNAIDAASRHFCWPMPRPVGTGTTEGPRARTGCGCAGNIPWRPSGPSPHPGSPTAVSPSFGTDSAIWTRH